MTTYKKGVMLLSDVKNYTSQSSKLGSEKTEQFLNHFESMIKPLVQTYYGYWLKRIGDGILVFFEDEINFLDFATKLRDISQEGGLDKEDFWCALRIVAHFGNFAFKELEENIGDLIGPEGIEVFRIEKYADAYDVVITEFLLSIIKNYLPGREITSHRIGRETLKGFGEDVTLFKLVFPSKGEKIHSNILKAQMDQLELTTREIPVFGDIYPPLRMEENFINLNIQSGKVHSSTGLEVQPQNIDKLLGVNEERIHDEDDTNKIDGRKSFNVEKLYQYFKRGIILGLPGSGKTTILKYFAFKEFKFNANLTLRGPKSNKVGEKKIPRLILMVECRNILDFDQWYVLRYGSLPIKHVPFNLETVLGYFTYCFVYHREKVETIDRELELAERIVCRSFRQGNLSILIDALDEALDVQVKNTIVEGVKLLFHEQDDLKMKTEQKDHGTRIFLTSRYSEQERFLWGRNGWILQPRFEVKSLDKNQLRDLAIHFYGENQEVFNRFDAAVWREDIAVKVGGTPLTALLVIAFFEIFGHFDTRYNMYHIMVVFILIRVWKRIKEKNFDQDMRTFFKMAKSKEILKEEVEAAVIYDALSLLAYAHADEGRVMKEEDILGVFKLFTQKEDKGNLDPEAEAEQLLKRLKEDHVLISAGPMDYVFIHSTVMEYLAAHFITEKITDPNYLDYVFPCPNLFQSLESKKQTFFDSEVLPIAVGSSIEKGANIIRFLGKHIQVVKNKREIVKLYQLSLKCLAEYENYIDRHYKLKRLKLLHKEMEKSIATHLKDVDWIYRTLKRIIVKSDEKQIKFWEASLKSISTLSRQYFFDNYLEYDDFVSNDSNIFRSRANLLYTLFDRDLVDQWIHKHQEENARSDGKYLEKIGDNLLTLNTKGYHPEDRNYFYYFKNFGEGLIGILGSPNFLNIDAVTCITYNSSGQLVASGSRDCTIKVWDADTGKEIQAFKGHLDTITSIIFSPDWEYLLSGSSDNTIRLWKTFYGKELRCIKGHKDDVTCLKYLPDGVRAVSSSKDHTIKIWNVDDESELLALEGHQAPVYSISISPDGNRIISCSGDRSIKLWDINDKKEIYTFKGHQDAVHSVCFSPDGKLFISGSADRTIGLWETTSRKLLRFFKKHSSEVMHVAFNSKGDQCLSFSLDGNVKLWSHITGKEILNHREQKKRFSAVNISPNGHRIVSGDDDGHINLLRIKDGTKMRIFRGHRSPVTSIDFSPNGRQLVSGSNDYRIILWDTENGKEKRVMDGHNAPITCVQFSPSCNYILSGSQDATIKLWTTHNGKEVNEFCGHTDSIRFVAFMPIGTQIISASNDLTVKMWDLKKGLIHNFEDHSAPILYLNFCGNGRNIVSVSEDNIIKIWDVSSGNKVKEYKGPCDHAECIYFLDEDKPVFSNITDHTINFWSPSSGRIIKTFTGHISKVTGIKFWKQYLISVSQDCTLKIWDIPHNQLVISIPLMWPPSDLKQHTTDKNIFATANDNGTITFFDIQKFLDKGHMSMYLSPHDRFILKDNNYEKFRLFTHFDELLPDDSHFLDIENLLDIEDLLKI